MRETPQTYALTIVCSERLSLLRPTHQAETFLAILFRYRAEGRFLLHAFVIMPDHVHMVLTPVASLEQTVGMLKGATSFALRKAYKGAIWQKGYYSHRIRDREDLHGQTLYIAANPKRKDWEQFQYIHTNYPEQLDATPDHLSG